MKTNNVVPFNFQGNSISAIVDKDKNTWFIAKEVCDILGIQNTTQALKSLDKDERSMLNIGRQGRVNIINEPGLYRLVFKSKKLVARVFQRWVTHEVLPAIRKTGAYELDMNFQDKMRSVASGYKDAMELIDKQQEEIVELNEVIQDNQEDLDVLDDLMDNGDTLTMTSAAKVFGIGRIKFNLRLAKLGMIFKQFNHGYGETRQGAWVPKQALQDRGYFVVSMKEYPCFGEIRYKPQTYITPDGMNFIAKKLAA